MKGWRRRIGIAILWLLTLVIVGFLGAWLADYRSFDERRRLSALDEERRQSLQEREKRLAAQLAEQDTETAAPAQSNISSKESLERLLGTGRRQEAPVKLPELPARAMEFDSRNPKAVMIERQVRHTWRVPDLDFAARALPVYLEASGIPYPNAHLARWQKSCELDLTLSKTELVLLVRLCGAGDWQLKSWQPPYPSHEYFTGSGDDRVRYQATFE